MTRDSFIRKWLGNRHKQYNEKCIDEMREDLDLVIITTLRGPSLNHKCSDCKKELTIVRPGKYQCDNPECESNLD
jgi:hypothetical protein